MGHLRALFIEVAQPPATASQAQQLHIRSRAHKLAFLHTHGFECLQTLLVSFSWKHMETYGNLTLTPDTAGQAISSRTKPSALVEKRQARAFGT